MHKHNKKRIFYLYVLIFCQTNKSAWTNGTYKISGSNLLQYYSSEYTKMPILNPKDLTLTEDVKPKIRSADMGSAKNKSIGR